MPRKSLVFSILAGLLLVFMLAGLSGCAAEEDIVDTADGDDRFETLVSALEAADLVDTLKGEGPYTVFAPTDDAFDKLPAGTLDALLDDIPTLKDILLYHVVAGELTAEEIEERTSASTLLGEDVSFSVADATVMVNDSEVVDADIQCSNGVIHAIDTVLSPPENIVDTAAGDGRFDILVTALGAADLADTLKGEGPYTVFAPTDDAFDQLPAGTVAALLEDTSALTDILLYHVVAGELRASEVAELTFATTLLGEDVSISVTNGTVMVDDAEVVEADILCTNGVIHAIDAVLLPPEDIVDTATADGRFETLMAALEAAGLDDTLKGEGPYTVFAPTDDAFNELPAGTVDALLNDIPALTDILLYHVVAGRVMSAEVVQLTAATTLLDEDVDITVSNSTVMVNDAEVIETDILCTNGVIHVIDKVLSPPAE